MALLAQSEYRACVGVMSPIECVFVGSSKPSHIGTVELAAQN